MITDDDVAKLSIRSRDETRIYLLQRRGEAEWLAVLARALSWTELLYHVKLHRYLWQDDEIRAVRIEPGRVYRVL